MKEVTLGMRWVADGSWLIVPPEVSRHQPIAGLSRLVLGIFLVATAAAVWLIVGSPLLTHAGSRPCCQTACG